MYRFHSIQKLMPRSAAKSDDRTNTGNEGLERGEPISWWLARPTDSLETERSFAGFGGGNLVDAGSPKGVVSLEVCWGNFQTIHDTMG